MKKLGAAVIWPFKHPYIAILLTIAAVVAISWLAPPQASVGPDDTLTWRHLEVPTTTTTVVTAHDEDVYLVVDGTTVYEIPKTTETARVLWLLTATHQGEQIR